MSKRYFYIPYTDAEWNLFNKVELLTAEKNALLQQLTLTPAQEKKMALCEVCGSFLVANDAAERTQSHVTGKQHLGYSKVREYLVEYKVLLHFIDLYVQ